MSTTAEWLTSLGMSEYAERFAENRIDLSVLRDLTDQDLKDLGVVLGDRRKMLRAIAALASDAPATPAPPRIPQDAAERRQLTVMFCDLVGSTALSARLDPEDLRGVIGAYDACCAGLVERHGGFVANYMGDGVMSYFGYPQAHEHDAERAVRAGLALVEAVPKLSTAARTPLQARVGIATGLVVVGDLLGAGQEQAVIGETPNLAARLQALAEPGTVVIASTTRRLTGGLFEYRDLGAVGLKGFARNVPAWQVLGASAAESRFEALRASTTPLVGRDEEVNLLLRRWEQAKRGEGSVVLISGEPGIGKSRIAETLLERLAGEPHTRLRNFCSPHHQDSAFYPSITQIGRAAGFRRDDTDGQRLAKLEAVLALATDDLAETVPLLAELLSVPTGDRYPPLDLTPQSRKEKTSRTLMAQIEGLAARQPVLLVIEDAHWSDPTSLELLELIVERAPSLPLLVVVTFRPEFAPPWVGRPQVTLISLNRLSRRLRVEMIAHVTAGKALPPEIAEQITDRTDGVPLFIEELTKAVVESGLLVDSGNRYVAMGSLAPLAIPTSLQASLLARLDRLGPNREVAQIAAALGRHFSHELIGAVAAMPQEQLDDGLARLVQAELIFRRGTPPDAQYTFKHALVQDAAYATLLRSRRRQLHARIAATLEEQFPEVVAAEPVLLAQHCAEAGLAEKAVLYWLKASQQAMARSAMTEAVAQLRKGLDALESLPDGSSRRRHELELNLALGPALSATKGWSATEVGETLARARALAEEVDRLDYIVPLSLGQWAFHMGRAELTQALSLAEQIEMIGAARHDVATELLGCRAQGSTRLFLGEFVAARALLERCHGLADPAHRVIRGSMSEDPYALMLTYLALALTRLGYLDQARLRLNEAVSEARRLRHAQTLAAVLTLANWTDIGWRQMQRHADELLALSTEHRFPLHLGWATAFRGWSLAALGQPREGLSLLTQGLEMLRATGNFSGTPLVLTMFGETCARLGQPGEALNCFAEAARIIEMTEERYHEAELHRLRGDVLSGTGDPAAAERSYHQALAVARQQNAKLFELRASISLARLWREAGQCGAARDLLAGIYGWFTEGFGTPILDDAKALLEELAR
ncbi:MAG TPA: AAA family ATPase [Stellaceae bacterium]|nr:AAA family ATPase [Stellaceae bacterium]